jgi:putative acetyltransferase
LDGLPGAYAPPSGRLLLATVNQEPAGCVALRQLGDGVCEMKRLWVRPPFRCLGVGRRLAEAIVDEARSIGYSCMRLDTVASMTAAIALYRRLGFVEISPYCGNPLPGAKFMELRPS